MIKAQIFIRLLGDQLDPEEVSQAIGLQPTLSWRKGETFETSSGRLLSRKTGLWELEIVDAREEAAERIKKTVAEISHVKDITKYVPTVELAQCHVIFEATAEPLRDENTMIYPPDLLILLGSIGLDLFIDIVSLDDN